MFRPFLLPPQNACVLLLLSAVLLCACGGGGGQFDGTTYRDSELSYRIGTPSGWARVRLDEENDLAWYQERLSAVIQVNGSCDPMLDIPLPALRNHLLIGFTDREVSSETRVPMASREALRTHLTARLDGVPREMVLVVMKKNECVYDFALVAPTGSRFDEAEPIFDEVVLHFSDEV